MTPSRSTLLLEPDLFREAHFSGSCSAGGFAGPFRDKRERSARGFRVSGPEKATFMAGPDAFQAGFSMPPPGGGGPPRASVPGFGQRWNPPVRS